MARCGLRGRVTCGCGSKQQLRGETMQRGSSGNTFVARQRRGNATTAMQTAETADGSRETDVRRVRVCSETL